MQPSALDSLQHVSRQVVFVLDRDLRIRALTPSARDYARVTAGREAEVGDSMLEFSDPRRVDAFRRRMAEAFEGHRNRVTRRIRIPGGVERVFEVTYDPVPGPEDRIERVLFGATDVTELHELRHRQELLEHALAGTAEGVLIADAKADDLPIVYANDATAQITGYSHEELLGKNCRFLQGDRRNQPGAAKIRDAIREQEPVRTRLENQRADGSWFWNEVSITPVYDADGQITHYLGIQRDVTEEQALRQQAERAERLLAAQLGTAGVVHDLNNLLAILELGLDDLLEQVDASPLRQQIDSLREVVLSGALLARRALFRGENEGDGCDVSALLSRRRKLLERLGGARARLVMDVAPDAHVAVTPSAVDRVVTNLVVNAADAIGAGGTIEVAVTTGRDDVTLTVTDDGPGILPSVREHLFEPMVSTKGSAGTGLGLATVKRLVEDAKGRVTVESRPGFTRFSVLLPRASSTSAQPKGPASVLYVEDEPLIARLVVQHLRRSGHDVRHVGSTLDAMRALGEALPDVLVTDLQLPDGSGLDLVTKVRAMTPTVGVVVTSGDLPPEVPDDVLRVAKPFGLLGLEQAVNRAWTRRGV